MCAWCGKQGEKVCVLGGKQWEKSVCWAWKAGRLLCHSLNSLTACKTDTSRGDAGLHLRGGTCLSALGQPLGKALYKNKLN